MARRRFLESVKGQADALLITSDIAESNSLDKTTCRRLRLPQTPGKLCHKQQESVADKGQARQPHQKARHGESSPAVGVSAGKADDSRPS